MPNGEYWQFMPMPNGCQQPLMGVNQNSNVSTNQVLFPNDPGMYGVPISPGFYLPQAQGNCKKAVFDPSSA